MPSAPAPQRVAPAFAAPKQQRSQRTLERLLDTAEALIEEKGPTEVSIPEIVLRAGSSVGGFYARFRDKNELLRALEDRFCARLDARLEEIADEQRWRDVPLPQVIEALAGELVAIHLEHRNLILSFLLRGAVDPEARQQGLQLRFKVNERIGALLRHRGAEISHPEPARGIDLAVQLAFGLMYDFVIVGEVRAGGRVLDADDLRIEICRAVFAYLGVDPAPRSHPPRPRRPASSTRDTRTIRSADSR